MINYLELIRRLKEITVSNIFQLASDICFQALYAINGTEKHKEWRIDVVLFTLFIKILASI